MQVEISGQVSRYATVVGVVTNMMVTSGRSSIAINSHVLFKLGQQSGIIMSIVKRSYSIHGHLEILGYSNAESQWPNCGQVDAKLFRNCLPRT